MQLALPAFLLQRGSFQKQLMERVRWNLAELDRQLASQKVWSRLEVEGGWYSILRVPATLPGDDLGLSLLNEKGVYAYPGHFYDFPHDGFLIVSLISEEKEFQIGLKSLLKQSC